MYIPKHFEETRLETLHGLMQSHPFAALVTQAGAELVVNHVPMLLDPSVGEFGMLRCHVARANPLWRQFSASIESVAIFQGPDAYVSPSWYPGKREHGKVVPTWNYAVVHAFGIPRVIDDAAWLLAHVTAMTSVQESRQPQPWKVSDAPTDFIDSMLKAIVGIEMPIAKLSGKWKLSQNRLPADRAGVVTELQSRSDDSSRVMAAWVKDANDK
jgi:transcriptional regulator